MDAKEWCSPVEDDLMEGGPGGCEDHPAAETRLFLESGGLLFHPHLRIADLSDAIDDPGKGPGEPAGVERPSRVVQVVDVAGRDARRG